MFRNNSNTFQFLIHSSYSVTRDSADMSADVHWRKKDSYRPYLDGQYNRISVCSLWNAVPCTSEPLKSRQSQPVTFRPSMMFLFEDKSTVNDLNIINSFNLIYF